MLPAKSSKPITVQNTILLSFTFFQGIPMAGYFLLFIYGVNISQTLFIYLLFSMQPNDNKKEPPFRISNRGLDHVDRFLTLTNKPHSQEKKYLAESDYRNDHEEARDNQLWEFEQVQAGKAYRIKNHKENRYMTLAKTTTLETPEYIAQLAPLGQGQQIWHFELGENRRFCIGIKPQHQEHIFYLESAEVQTLKPRYKTVFLLRHKIPHDEKRRYLQYWKFSPLKVAPEMPNYDRQEALGLLTEKQRQILLSFKGAVFTQNTPSYKYQVYQYATSSFPQSQMSPYMLVQPLNITDIQIALRFAQALQKKVVVRSGGHQYSGTSSGGNDTIVISLNSFNDLKINSQGLIEIGPCNALKDVSKFLRDQGVSVPHGVCPLVNIGGHGQTGGYGNFTRSFGLLIDYVQAFDIVLPDGTFTTIKRPTVANTERQKLDLQIFRGVLGGNAGSFGIVTKYYIKPILDADHPQSYSIQHERFFDKQAFKAVLKEFQRWSQLIADNNDEQLRGLDLFFSLTQVTIPRVQVQKTVMSLTGLYSDPDGGKPYSGQFDKLFQRFDQGLFDPIIDGFLAKNLDNPKNPNHPDNPKNPLYRRKPLSAIAESYVVRYPLMTIDGRQFALPYKKRGNVTTGVLTDAFINEFADQTQSVPKQKQLNLIVQMIAGGGQHRIKGERKVNGVTVTSIPLRNLTHTFSFDVFYNSNIQGAQLKAEQAQKVMQQTVMNHYSNPSGEKLFFWTSYGDLDMTKPEVVNRFYDSPEQYRQLQQLKTKIDPNNLLSSKMTVKPL